MRTVLSALQVATRGRRGCGAVSQVRSREGGVRGERRVMVAEGFVDIFEGVWSSGGSGMRDGKAEREWWFNRAEIFEIVLLRLPLWVCCSLY